MAQLSIYVLGSFQVLREAEIVTKAFRTSKERALLAYLAIEWDRRHSREALAELLWPGRPEGVARTNLRQALAGVRQAIGDREALQPHLKVSDESVRIEPQNAPWLDVHTFQAHIQATQTHSHKSIQVCPVCAQHLEEAISLYRGDLLAEIHLAGCQRFQEWVLFQREQYARQMLTALANLSRYDEQRGYLDSALKYARQHVQLAPLEEAAHRQVMKLLAKSGLRSAALEQFLTCRRILAQELGVEPASETEALFERIKHGTRLESKSSPSPTPQNDLPLPLTSFVDRYTELDWLAKCLSSPTQRLLTITGMAGIGKTRLALQAASANRASFPDGVYFADLAEAHSADQFVAALAGALELPHGQQNDPTEALWEALRPLHALIVLDSYDPLRGHTNLLLGLLQQAPGVKLLVTSRGRLNFQSEIVLTLQGLDYPQEGEAQQVMDCSAVQLFLARARHSQPGFEPTPQNIPAIVGICQLLEGHPLGLELAAAALRETTCEQLALALPDHLELLQTSLQDLPEKHRDMRTTLERCYLELSPEEQDAYRKLAIFERDFSPQAAQQVTAISLPLLTSLVDRSVLCGCVAERFCLHPLMRVHARAKLSADQALFTRLKNQHRRYYLQPAGQIQSSPSSNGDDHIQGRYPQIEVEFEHFRPLLAAAAERGEAGGEDLSPENLGCSHQAQADAAAGADRQPGAASLYDPLTGLPNKALFYDRLKYSLSLATRESRHFALLLLDLDSFRALNENFGQEAGDAMLQRVAARLRECLRESDSLSRLEGDQFGILLENLQNADSASIVAEKILKKIAIPYQLASGGVQMTTSIGISYYPDSGTEAELLLQNADRALRIVKSDGRNSYQLFRQPQTADLNI